jgi:hypothetical protein
MLARGRGTTRNPLLLEMALDAKAWYRGSWKQTMDQRLYQGRCTLYFGLGAALSSMG